MSGRDDDPPFAAPWEASVFALKELMLARGAFTAAEWSEALGRERAASAAAGEGERLEGEPGIVYWRDAVRALEGLLAEKGVLSSEALAARQEDWREAAAATPHGEPVTLERIARGGTGRAGG